MKMKSWIYKVLLVFTICSFFTLAVPGAPATAATEEEIESAVATGLSWLAAQQRPDGAWLGDRPTEAVAYTGLAVLAFEMDAIARGLDPMSAEYEYEEPVRKGLEYILQNKHSQVISPQIAGDPDGNGNGIGLYFVLGDNYHVNYNTGIAMMAIAASGHPELELDGVLLRDVLQDAVDYLAWGQADPDSGFHRGGWSYSGIWPGSDNSNSGYITSGLGFAAAPPPYGFGLTVPHFVKDELSIWIDIIQVDVTGSPEDGGSSYLPTWVYWVNILKTGNLLYEMALVGDSPEIERVKDAVDYIVRHWYDPSGRFPFQPPGWRDHRQAIFTMMKGLESLGIDRIDLDGDGVAEHDWFDEVSTHLVDTQNPDGFWPTDYWGDQVLSTAGRS